MFGERNSSWIIGLTSLWLVVVVVIVSFLSHLRTFFSLPFFSSQESRASKVSIRCCCFEGRSIKSVVKVDDGNDAKKVSILEIFKVMKSKPVYEVKTLGTRNKI